MACRVDKIMAELPRQHSERMGNYCFFVSAVDARGDLGGAHAQRGRAFPK